MRDIFLYVIILAIFLSLVSGGYVVRSYFEMRTFNKFTTGKRANLIDALFAELRIMSECEK
jgi:hypothetical protein